MVNVMSQILKYPGQTKPTLVIYVLHNLHGQLGQSIQEWNKYSLWKTAFEIFEVIWFADHFKLFKGCLPKISFGPFLNTLPQLSQHIDFIFSLNVDRDRSSLISVGIKFHNCGAR